MGNTLEDLLGIEENNLPIPNAAEWELKCQRRASSSLTTLFHMEPSPRALRFVPRILLPKYGWGHAEAGTRYPKDEMSFRQTINAIATTDRGFGLFVNRDEQKVVVSFDSGSAGQRHSEWLESVRVRTGLGEIDPQPYWGFIDLSHKAGSKLVNCFYVLADTKKERGQEFFHYAEIAMLETFSFQKFIATIEKGDILVDFDARTGHNHGTKFRLRQNRLPDIYEHITEIT